MQSASFLKTIFWERPLFLSGRCRKRANIRWEVGSQGRDRVPPWRDPGRVGEAGLGRVFGGAAGAVFGAAGAELACWRWPVPPAIGEVPWCEPLASFGGVGAKPSSKSGIFEGSVNDPVSKEFTNLLTNITDLSCTWFAF